MSKQKEVFVVLLNIRSTYNVGAIFRTADAVEVSKIYLVGHTPAPTDRFGRKNERVAKTALGAEDVVSWEQFNSYSNVLKNLRNEKVQIVAVEQTKNAISYKKFKPQKSTAFVFGSETEGLPVEMLELADTVVEIPMRGEKKSLNVSVAAGVVLYHYV